MSLWQIGIRSKICQFCGGVDAEHLMRSFLIHSHVIGCACIARGNVSSGVLGTRLQPFQHVQKQLGC